MIQIEVRNARGVTVSTFGDIDLALKFVCDRTDLGHLDAWAVETIRRERQITEAPAFPFRGARGLRAGGRGR